MSIVKGNEPEPGMTLRDEIARAMTTGYHTYGHFDSDEVSDDDLAIADSIIKIVHRFYTEAVAGHDDLEPAP